MSRHADPRNPTWCALLKPMMPHCVPRTLKDRLVENLLARGVKPPIQVRGRITRWDLDLPGPCMTDRHIHDLSIPGLRVQVASTDVEFLRERLVELPLRNEIGVPYYKLNDGSRCLCLIPEMRDVLLAEFDRVLPEAHAIASIENARLNEAFAEGMRKGVLFQAHPRPTGKIGNA